MPEGDVPRSLSWCITEFDRTDGDDLELYQLDEFDRKRYVIPRHPSGFPLPGALLVAWYG